MVQRSGATGIGRINVAAAAVAAVASAAFAAGGAFFFLPRPGAPPSAPCAPLKYHSCMSSRLCLYVGHLRSLRCGSSST